MPKVLLKDVVARIKDKVDKDNTDLKYYIGGEHFDSGEIQITKKGIIKESTIGPAFHMRFQPGDVLLMSRNPHLRKAGIVDFEGICSDVSYVCRTKDENVLMQRFIPFIFQTDHFWKFAEENKKGSTNFFLNWSDFEKYEFELPQIDEQKKLCEMMWAFEDTKSAYKDLLLQTDKLVKSQFIEMFGDPDNNSKNWPLVSLKDCLVAIDSGKSITCENYPRTGDLPAILKLSAVTYGEYQPEENKQLPLAEQFIKEAEVHVGDLLFSRKNTLEYVGMTALVKQTPPKLMMPDLIFRLVPQENVRPQYLHQLINHPMYRGTISGLANGSAGSMPNISKQKLNNLAIPLPPVELQMEIEPFIEQSDKSKFISFKSQFIGGIQRAFDEGRVTTLGKMVEEERPITYGIVKPGHGCPGGVPVVKVKDMQDGAIDESNLLLTTPELDYQYRRSRLRTGDLLISIRGSVGRLAEIPESLENANITQDTARLTISPQYNKIYVRGVLESPILQWDMEKNIRGVAVKGINIGYLRELKMPVCSRERQDELAMLYQQSDKSK